MDNREFKIVCAACRKSFDLLKSEWCHFHRWGTHSKICPYCGECACKAPEVFAKWSSIHKQLSLYGTKKGISVKQFLIDGISSSVMWCTIWSIVYLLIGLPFIVFVYLMLGVIVMNFTIGGIQGKWIDMWRKKFL